jgi:hypothetical protein
MAEEKTNLGASENSKSAEDRLKRFFEESKKNRQESNNNDFGEIKGAMEKIFTPDKESVSEISSAESDNVYGKILAKVKTKTTSVKAEADEIKKDAHSVSKMEDAEKQITHLVELAMAKDIYHAVKVARYLEDNYILDKFRDNLIAKEFHDALVKKGVI